MAARARASALVGDSAPLPPSLSHMPLPAAAPPPTPLLLPSHTHTPSPPPPISHTNTPTHPNTHPNVQARYRISTASVLHQYRISATCYCTRYVPYTQPTPMKGAEKVFESNTLDMISCWGFIFIIPLDWISCWGFIFTVLDCWDLGGVDGAVAETEARDGPSGARYAGGGMLGSLPLPRLAGLAATAVAAIAASALCLALL